MSFFAQKSVFRAALREEMRAREEAVDVTTQRTMLGQTEVRPDLFARVCIGGDVDCCSRSAIPLRMMRR